MVFRFSNVTVICCTETDDYFYVGLGLPPKPGALTRALIIARQQNRRGGILPRESLVASRCSEEPSAFHHDFLRREPQPPAGVVHDPRVASPANIAPAARTVAARESKIRTGLFRRNADHVPLAWLLMVRDRLRNAAKLLPQVVDGSRGGPAGELRQVKRKRVYPES